MHACTDQRDLSNSCRLFVKTVNYAIAKTKLSNTTLITCFHFVAG